jgi:uncharacterized repeat protein (TIGR03803 family)
MRSVVILFGVALTVVAGCSQQTVSSTPASNAALAVPRVRAGVTFSTIYNFKGAPDGSIPEAGLTLFAGKFYGTTTAGGTGAHNDGTIFDVGLDGTEHVRHSFTFTPDGSKPGSGLTNLNNLAMYGTTSVGGDKSVGIVYEFKSDGSYRIVYSFKNGADGANPDGDLTVLNNLLYGTTLFGGADANGVVFEVHTDGTERVVYAFTGMPDGDRPHGGMAQLNGTLYGTTELGGANNLGCVFSVKPDGTEKVIYSFKGAGSSDGSAPLAGLTVLNGLLYGVTSKGGANDDGTVFEVHDDGTERVIHSFNGSDGMYPYAGLTVLKGLLYGTTIRGGANDFGTVFEVHTDGTFRMLHDFTGTEGAKPQAILTAAAGNALIGTARRGGTTNNGTVFLVQL